MSENQPPTPTPSPHPSQLTSNIPLKKETVRVTLSENQSPAPSQLTSSVPLKKETVRVTLKASDAPPAVPSATVPMAQPVRPPAPGGGPPTPTIPAGAPRPTAPAPTIPLRTAGAPTAAPAPTIRLASSAPVTKPGGAPTQAGGTPTLPKATVQLQAPTQSLGAPLPITSQVATLHAEDEEEEGANEGVVKILSGVGLAAAIVLLAFQLMLAKTWISVDQEKEINPRYGDWTQLFE